jgi:DNA repair protein RadD
MKNNLRKYQVDAINQLRQSILKRHRNIVLQLATGGGKTTIAAEMIRSANAKGKKCLFLADRVELVEQTSKRFDYEGIEHGIIMADHWRYKPHEKNQICSPQTLARRAIPPADVVIIDECFTAGTLISTPNGDKPIDQVRCGDIVYNQCGVGIVEAVSIKPSTDIYRLEFDNGIVTTCTGNHPFFTERGWVTAKELVNGTYLFSIEAVRLLWERVSSLEKAKQSGKHSMYVGKELEQARMLLNILCKEIQESDEQSSSSIKNESETSGDKTQTYQTWRKRAITTLATACTSSCFGGGVGIGVSDTDQDTKREWLSNLLQAGFGKPIYENGNRDRRIFSYHNSKKRTGFKKDKPVGFTRVVSVSNIKREGSTPVFNLQISGHPSFFADGNLVHNCHVAYGVHRKMMQALPNAVFIGLSATPFTKGLGKMYSDLVVGATTAQLTDEGYLVPVKVFAPSKPDLSKLRTIGGDYDEKELFARVNKPKLIADVVDTWIKLGENRPTIGFAVNVLHSQYLCEQFKDRGIRAAHIDAYMSKTDRDQIVKDFKSGYIRVLFNVGILDKGFDYPEASCLIMARPTKSLMVYIQQAGRVLRTHESKTDAIILDHAGNTETHGFVTDDLPQELDDGTKKKVERTEKEQKEKVKLCPSCSFVKKNNDYQCPCCGFTPKKKDVGIESAEGELLEVTRKKKVTLEDKQKLYSELLYIEIEKGYKRGFAAQTYRNKYGVWPKGLNDLPVKPSDETMNYVKSRFIAYGFKRKA